MSVIGRVLRAARGDYRATEGVEFAPTESEERSVRGSHRAEDQLEGCRGREERHEG